MFRGFFVSCFFIQVFYFLQVLFEVLVQLIVRHCYGSHSFDLGLHFVADYKSILH